MNLGSGLDPFGDEIEEGEEFLRAVTFDHLAGDLSGGDIARSISSLTLPSDIGLRPRLRVMS